MEKQKVDTDLESVTAAPEDLWLVNSDKKTFASSDSPGNGELQFHVSKCSFHQTNLQYSLSESAKDLSKSISKPLKPVEGLISSSDERLISPPYQHSKCDSRQLDTPFQKKTDSTLRKCSDVLVSCDSSETCRKSGVMISNLLVYDLELLINNPVARCLSLASSQQDHQLVYSEAYLQLQYFYQKLCFGGKTFLFLVFFCKIQYWYLVSLTEAQSTSLFYFDLLWPFAMISLTMISALWSVNVF